MNATGSSVVQCTAEGACPVEGAEKMKDAIETIQPCQHFKVIHSQKP